MTETLLGLQIVPTMPIDELVETAKIAEDIGYDYCMVADEGLMSDVYVALGAIARSTQSMRLGAVTNGYTRHPAVTAAALATVNELSGGRAFVTLVAGGTMVLDPMGIERRTPLVIMDESIEIMRALWTGRSVTWQGHRFCLESAQLSAGPQDIPIWMAVKGERLLRLAGEKADGVVLMARADLADALEQVDLAGNNPTRAYLDRLAFTPQMVEEAKELYAYAIMDSPQRMLENLGIDHGAAERMREAFESGGPTAVAPLVTEDMVAAVQIVGSPEYCQVALADLIKVHQFDVFLINIISPGLEANRELLSDVTQMIRPKAA